MENVAEATLQAGASDGGDALSRVDGDGVRAEESSLNEEAAAAGDDSAGGEPSADSDLADGQVLVCSGLLVFKANESVVLKYLWHLLGRTTCQPWGAVTE